MSRTAGIIGHPVGHSLSPAFQQAAFDHCGLDIRYEKWDTPPEGLEARVEALRGQGMVGANVTIPHKERVIPLLDEVGGLAARVGAVNTIVAREGRLFGFNTDGPGFVAALRNEAHFDPAGASVLIAGAGGAARGVAFALAEAGARSLVVTNRNPGRGERLAYDVTEDTGVPARAETRPDLAGFGLLVNCTSVGMEGTGTEAQVPFDLDGAAAGALAVDIVYRPRDTAWLQAARAKGLKTLGGLPMLIYQGALAFELWTGLQAPVDVMFEAARNELSRLPSP